MADYEHDNQFKLTDYPDRVYPQLRHTNKWDHKQCNHTDCMNGVGLYTIDEDIVIAYSAMLDAIDEMFERVIRPKLEEQGWEEPTYTIYRGDT